MTLLDKPDPVAIAAATAQGWTYALDTVGRPAPEHLAAAQEAYHLLAKLGRSGQWNGVLQGLNSSLAAARARLAPPDLTIDQLVAGVERLRTIGLVPAMNLDMNQALDGVRATKDQRDRIAELEASERELISAAGEADEENSALAGQLLKATELRDRFERELRQAREGHKAAWATRSNDTAAAIGIRERAVRREVLAGLGFNPPGFDQMPDDELAATMRTALAEAAKLGEKHRLLVAEANRKRVELDAAITRSNARRTELEIIEVHVRKAWHTVTETHGAIAVEPGLLTDAAEDLARRAKAVQDQVGRLRTALDGRTL